MAALEGKMQEEPLHSGEIFHLWTYLYESKADLVLMQVLINHTETEDLKAFLEDLLENSYTEEEKQVEIILKETGIRLPPAPPDRPNVELQDIPAGARLQDAEIAILLQKELMNGKMRCSYITSMLEKEDIISLFNEFFTQKSNYEQKLLNITKEKGWHVSPPINIK